MMDEIDELPGMEWDKNAAWDKLQMRRSPKPAKKKKHISYGIAAAAILCILAATLFLNREDNEPAVTEVSKPALPTVAATDKTERIIYDKEVKQEPIVTVTHSSRTITKIQGESLTNTTTANTDTAQEIKTLATDVVAVTADTTQPVPAAYVTVEKKKLKTVHINDITTEVTPFKPVRQESILNLLSPGNRENTAYSTPRYRAPTNNRLKLNSYLEN